MTAIVPDNRVRALLPFRIHKWRGDVFLEYDHEALMFDNSKRLLPFQIQNGQPVIEPILKLMEMYSALEDALQPLQKKVDALQGEADSLKGENARLKKSVEELKRQNENLRRERR